MPSKRVFLDTNGWLALLSASDALHSYAAASWRNLLTQGYTVFLTDWVVAETGNGLARSKVREQFVRAVDLVRQSSQAQLIPVNGDLLQDALTLYASRPDKTWGLVDCASFLVMEDEGIQEAFTNDRHFAQAGLHCLLPLP